MFSGVHSTTRRDLYLWEEMFLGVYILQPEVTYTNGKKCSRVYILQSVMTTYVKKCSWVYILQPEVTTYVKKCS